MDKTAIVTGAARGIGAEIAVRLGRDGYNVGVLDIEAGACETTVARVRDAGGRATAVGVDVTDEQAVADAVSTVQQELGAPTILVNNAGITKDALLFRMDASDWDAVMSVHLRGSFLMSRAMQSFMVEARDGRIVNLSSTSALGNRGQANYSAAKAGLQGFTKTLAIELGPYGITANAIAPGFIASDMTAKTAQALGLTFDELKSRAAAAIPLRRVGAPADVANLVAFLVGHEASFISGQVIYVAGGPRC